METFQEHYLSMKRTIAARKLNVDMALIDRAVDYAREKHKDQKRKDGSPYIIHPLAVAEIVAEIGLDTDAILGALLHDCIEDTDSTYDDIARNFGPTVASLVEGVTKLTRVEYSTLEEQQMENLRKMFMAMSKDIRVILIKIADRLHNTRTMQFQSPEKQISKSRETMDIYAPLAHRLGMQKIKWELEDTSLKYLDPEGYNEIMRYLNAHQAEADAFMKAIQSKITTRLSAVGIHGSIYGRIKHVYSIYRKMKAQNKTIDELYDMYAFRVIVDSIPDCYNVLGHIHDLFNLVPGRFKDYISTPKPNMYQSLHTTVIGQQGIPFEVQIRTWEMHETAEYGIAAHWKYKQGVAGGDEKQFEWVRRLLETQQDSDAEDYIHSLKVDMFDDEVFVFTPKGKVMSLPSGSTPIDFAYAIHSGVGNAMVGAKVNNRIASYDQQLCNGDIVEVLTSKTAKGPSRDWLNICKSNGARTKIKQWFKKEKREENIVHGKASFEGRAAGCRAAAGPFEKAGIRMPGRYVCCHRLWRPDGGKGVWPHPRRADPRHAPDACAPGPRGAEAGGARKGRPPQGFRRHRRGHRFLHDQILALLHAGAGRRHRRLYYKGLRRVHPPPRLPQRSRCIRSEAGRALGQGRVEHGG